MYQAKRRHYGIKDQQAIATIMGVLIGGGLALLIYGILGSIVL